MSDDEVREATAALKGMLGISGAAGDESESKESSSAAAQTKQSGGGKKGKKKRNKKDGKGSGGKRGNNKREYCRNSSEGDNFAWSAFQSSPDASALPIPIFASTSSLNNNDNDDSDDNNDDNIDNTNDETTKEKLPAILTGSALPQQSPGAQPDMLTAEDLEKEVLASLKDTPQQKQQQMQDTHTGVNLAQFASTDTNGRNTSPPASPPSSAPTQTHRPDTIHTPDPATPSATNTPTNYYHQTFLQQQQQQQYPSPYLTHHHHPQAHPSHQHAHTYHIHSPTHPYAQTHQFSSPQNTHHTHHTHHHYPSASLPADNNAKYVTVPVQVPPAIPPNRQIMVPTPNGYLPVLLPEGVRPGMVVPVTLPIISQSHTHTHQQQRQQQSQFHTHTTSPQTNTTSQKQQTPTQSKPQNTSWAARVASSPSSNNNRKTHAANAKNQMKQ